MSFHGKFSPYSILVKATILVVAFELGYPVLKAQQPGLDAPVPVLPFLNGSLPSQTPEVGSSWQLVNAFPNLIFQAPTQMLPIPGSNRLMVAEKNGGLLVIENDPTTTGIATIIDFSDQVDSGGDSGFLGFAFHPEFGDSSSPNKHYLYIYYRYTPDQEVSQFAYCRLSRLTWDPTTFSIDPASEFVLIQQFDRQSWHNGGGIFFGDDGFLYLSIGDEGGANDPYDSTQEINESLFSGIFRIDVDQKGGDVSHPIRRQPQNAEAPPLGWPNSFTQGYYIPSDNPWLDPGGSILEEFWAVGARSPHRMTLDRVTGDIYLGDVGQNAREEISLVTAEANLQWPYREGSIAGSKPKPTELIGNDQEPLFDYGRDDGSCVIGGFVYRGVEHAINLEGKYIFGDYTTGAIWALTRESGNVSRELLLNANFGPFALQSFGTDQNGEVYALTSSNSNQVTGTIYKLVRTGQGSPQPPATLSATGAFSSLEPLMPSNALIPYRVNAPLWSDGALKSRWIAIPNDGTPDTASEQITYSENDNWQFPVGTVIIKHFALEGRRLETRFLVHGSDGEWFGFTYRWREDHSDADLLLNGLLETVSIGGQDYQWTYPSRASCLRCHTPSMGRVLGVRTHQLNGDLFYPSSGRLSNQLLTLSHLGFFDTPPADSSIPDLMAAASWEDSGASLEQKARSYLDSNCAHCHNPGEDIRPFDFRLTTPFNEAGVLNGPVQNNFGYTGATEITPGDAWRSMAWIRQNTTDPGASMPPLGRHRIDTEAINWLYQWIESMDSQDYSLPTGLKTRLTFEEGSGNNTLDRSGNNNDGLFIGSAAWDTGKSGGGVATDGSSGLVQISHSSDIHLGVNNEDFTVAFHVNLQEGFTGSYRGLAGKGTSWNQRGLGIFMRPDSNRFEISISTTAYYNDGFSAASPLPVGEWVHLTIVKEGIDMSVYLDGELDRDTSLDGETIGTLEDFHLGRGPGGADFTEALFDNLMIFNRALDPEEVSQIANDTPVTGPDDPNTQFNDAISSTTLTGSDTLPGAIPFADGVSNLLKYAFNLDLNGLDRHYMPPDGSSGLPSFSLVEEGDQLFWRIEYVRRRTSGLTYTPMLSTELVEGSWSPAAGTEFIFPIDPTWERIIHEAPYLGTHQFGKVSVTLP